MGTIGPNSFIHGVPSPEGPLGPGGEQKPYLGPGGEQKPYVGPGGEQQPFVGPGGVQQQHMHIDPSSEGLMPILPPSLSSMQSTIAQLQEEISQAGTTPVPQDMQNKLNALAKQLENTNTTLQVALPQYQQIHNMVVAWVKENPEMQTRIANIIPLEPGPEIGGGS